MPVRRNFTILELVASRTARIAGVSNDPPMHLDAALRVTLAGLERVRAYLGEPMLITSGYRSVEVNQLVGGKADSQHMKGQAVDFVSPRYGTPEKVARALSPAMTMLGIDQMVLEPSWVHISFTLEPRYEVLRQVGAGKYQLGLG